MKLSHSQRKRAEFIICLGLIGSPAFAAPPVVYEGPDAIARIAEQRETALSLLGMRLGSDPELGLVLELPKSASGEEPRVGSGDKKVQIRKITVLADGLVRLDYSNRSYDILTRIDGSSDFEVKSVDEATALAQPADQPWQQECTYDRAKKAVQVGNAPIKAGNAYNFYGMQQYAHLIRTGVCKFRYPVCELKPNETGKNSLFVDGVPVKEMPSNWQDLETLVEEAQHTLGCAFQRECEIGKGPSGAPLGMMVGKVFIPANFPAVKEMQSSAAVSNVVERAVGRFGKAVCPTHQCEVKHSASGSMLHYNRRALELSAEQLSGLERSCSVTGSVKAPAKEGASGVGKPEAEAAN